MQSVRTFTLCHNTMWGAAQQHSAAAPLLRHSVEIQQAQNFFPPQNDIVCFIMSVLRSNHEVILNSRMLHLFSSKNLKFLS